LDAQLSKNKYYNYLFLRGNKIYLRPISENDVDWICQGENSPDVREAMFFSLPITLSREKEKIQQYLESQESIVLIIVENETNIPIGQTAFFRIDYISRSTIFYLVIFNSDYWSLGIGSEVTEVMINYAFQTLNLNRIQLHVCAENTPAIKIYQRTGFVKEGVLRQAMYRNGNYVDFWVMGMLRQDWLHKER